MRLDWSIAALVWHARGLEEEEEEEEDEEDEEEDEEEEEEEEEEVVVVVVGDRGLNHQTRQGLARSGRPFRFSPT